MLFTEGDSMHPGTSDLYQTESFKHLSCGGGDLSSSHEMDVNG